jgi:CHAT domain-containing protein/tetratricopeptide (TPR) repeat protein
MTDRQRIQAYLQLIQSLLSCPSGQEPAIFYAHQELLDAGLVQAMEQLAAALPDESAANWLRGMAAQLAEALGMTSSISGDLEREITAWQQALEVYTFEAFPQQWADLQNNLAAAYIERIRGDRGDNLERAIAACQEALKVRTFEGFPQQWADTQNNLALAYYKRIRGERADNLERAIAGYQETLKVRTFEAFPYEWARTQSNLANPYRNRIRGERADNLERAITACQEALKVFTFEAFPQHWAGTQNNLAGAYIERIRGERADNLERAIAACQEALKVFTFEAFPQHWAMTQNNLAAAYYKRIRGERADNLERAITACQEALKVYTFDDFPQQWAMTQDNLANTYLDRIRGDRDENLERVLTGYQQALKVWTYEVFPYEWARTQNTLATAYIERIRGDKAENLERAISCYQEALKVRNFDAFPYEWADTQNNLATAYYRRIRGERADNLERALAGYQQAMKVYTFDDFPQQWATTQNNLANTYLDRIRGDRDENLERAISCYQEALKVRNFDVFPYEWAMTQNNLAIAYRNRSRGERAENVETAIAYCNASLEVFTFDAFPYEWAMTQNNLANTYLHRIRGDRAENLETAIAGYREALKVFTFDAFPQQWATTQAGLGNAYSNRSRGEQAENLETAIACCREALKVFTFDAFPYEWAGTQNNLAAAYRERSRNLAAAYSNRIRGERADNLEQVFAAGQMVFTLDQNIKSAIACCQEALKVFTPSGFPLECLTTGRNLGELAFTRGWWERAIFGYGQAIAAVETSRSWATSEERRQEILRESIDIYEEMVQACINNGQLDKALEYAERSRSRRLVDLMAGHDLYSDAQIPPEVQQYLEKYNQLQQQLDNIRFNNQRDSNRELATAARSDYARYQQANQSSQALEAQKRQLGLIKELEAQKQQIWQQMRRLDPVLAGQQQVSTPNFAAMQQLIDAPTTALLSFYSTQDRTHVFILRQDQLTCHTCEGQGQEQLQNWIYEQWLRTYVNNKTAWRQQQHFQSFLAELANRLEINSLIAEHLQGIEELILVPHIHLHQIPLVALPLAEDSREVESGEQREDQVVAPDLRSLDEINQVSEISEPTPVPLTIPLPSPLKRGKPDLGMLPQIWHFLQQDITTLLSHAQTQSPNLPHADTQNRDADFSVLSPSKKTAPPPVPQPPPSPQPSQYLGDKFRIRIVPSCQILEYCTNRPAITSQKYGTVEDATEDLPCASFEGEQIAQMFHIPNNQRLQGRQGATIAHYRELVQQVHTLHSSHHAASRLDDPLESMLVLGDGTITLGQLFTWRFPDLNEVFLSCCETGLGLTEGLTDDILTIGAGFLSAGARTVISTLWSVDDLATALFSIFYYKSCQEGHSRSRALQMAQKRLRELKGEELGEQYAPQIQPILAQRKEQTSKAQTKARQQRDHFPAGSADYQKWEAERQRLQKLEEKITYAQQNLAAKCQQDLPFANPVYWAAFTCQGLN